MESLMVLNTREKKDILRKIKDRWGAELKTDLVFLLSSKKKIFLSNSDLGKVDYKSMRIDKIGLYLGEIVTDREFRLSIEGAQIIGPLANKNVVELSDGEAKVILHGNDLIKKDIKECISDFVILKNRSDFIGCGKVRGESILNFIPKTRRILSED